MSKHQSEYEEEDNSMKAIIDDLTGADVKDTRLTVATMALSGGLILATGGNPITAVFVAAATGTVSKFSGVLVKRGDQWKPKLLLLGVALAGVIAMANNQRNKV